MNGPRPAPVLGRHGSDRIRSLLFAPGGNSRILAKVFARGADAVNLDLEDGISIEEKKDSRRTVASAVRSRTGLAYPRVIVRLNPPDSDLFEDDLNAVIVPGIWGVHITKLGDVDRLQAIDDLLTSAERRTGLDEGQTRLVVSVDSAGLALHLPELTTASPRLVCVTVGGMDFSFDIGTTVSDGMIESLWARQYAVICSRAAGIAGPLHPTPFDLEHDTKLRRVLEEARQLGFQGAVANHPRQLEAIHAAFTPSPEEVEWAVSVLTAYRKAANARVGVTKVAGELVDIASARHAESMLEAIRHPLVVQDS
jgi:citrate lyase subunit beta/citryl-CoA lyase